MIFAQCGPILYKYNEARCQDFEHKEITIKTIGIKCFYHLVLIFMGANKRIYYYYSILLYRFILAVMNLKFLSLLVPLHSYVCKLEPELN